MENRPNVRFTHKLRISLQISIILYINDRNLLNPYSCPYYIGNLKLYRLISFTDASEQAYCAAVYVLTMINTRLYCSKTWVAPLNR